MSEPGSRIRVVNLARREANCIRFGDGKYVLLQLREESPQMVDTRCPHRGGPLHLGHLDESGDKVVCPMHRLSIPMARLERTALPMIVRRDLVTVVLPGSDDLPEAPYIQRVLTTIGCTHFEDLTTRSLAKEG